MNACSLTPITRVTRRSRRWIILPATITAIAPREDAWALRIVDISVPLQSDIADREIGHCPIEKLHHLEALPPRGFTFACVPVKIKAASAGWTRAVAIIES